MKNLEKLSVKEIRNTEMVKGGAYGRGTKGTASQSSTRTELL